MLKKIMLLGAAGLLTISGAALSQASSGINDAQIAHIAYTAGAIDVAAGKQALEKSKNRAVREFAEEMVRDHQAVNDQALALVAKLTPDDVLAVAREFFDPERQTAVWLGPASRS